MPEDACFACHRISPLNLSRTLNQAGSFRVDACRDGARRAPQQQLCQRKSSRLFIRKQRAAAFASVHTIKGLKTCHDSLPQSGNRQALILSKAVAERIDERWMKTERLEAAR
jgi:hypothetical protein